MAKATKKTKRAKDERPPEIAVVGEVYEEVVADVIRELLEVPEGGEATIYIDSAGGSVYSAMAIATLIRLRKIRATGMVLSECSSASILNPDAPHCRHSCAHCKPAQMPIQTPPHPFKSAKSFAHWDS